MKEAAVRKRDSHALWLLPAAFVVHDAEELATESAWLAEHRQTLQATLQKFLHWPGATVPEMGTTVNVGIAMLSLLALFTVVTVSATRYSRSRTALFFYLVALGGFFVHGFAHLGQTIVFGAYTPGVVTAVIVVIPISLFLYSDLLSSARVTVATVIGTACLGALLILPAILLALFVGHSIAG
jgi:hypothetical protein